MLWTVCTASPVLLHVQDIQGWDYKKVLGKGSINKKVAAGWWEGGGLNSTLTFMVIFTGFSAKTIFYKTNCLSANPLYHY